MKYQLLVLDIDGTVTNSEKKITPKTRQALLNLQEKGIPVAIASGRHINGIAPIADELMLDHYGGYVLSLNGARIFNWKTKECIFSRTFTSSLSHRLYQDALEYDLGLLTYEGDYLLSSREPDQYTLLESKTGRLTIKIPDNFPQYVNFPVNKYLFTGAPEEIEQVEPIMARKYINEASVFRSEPFYLEVTPKNVDKAFCLERLLKILDISRNAMVCCGDGYNDITMIRLAGMGVAMANAQEELKKYATYITASNDEDGVAQVVEKFFND